MPLMQKHRVLGDHPSYHYAETVTDATSAPLYLPNEARGVAAGVIPGTSARVEVSISTLAEIEANTADWFPWAAGDVAEATIDYVAFNVTAMRLVSVGTSRWVVSA